VIVFFSSFFSSSFLGGVEEEVDPLDAYMQTVHQEARRSKNVGVAGPAQQKKSSIVEGVAKSKKMVVMTGVAKKKTAETKKGELMEQNQDALEYSSESEGESAQEMLSGLMAQRTRRDLVKIDHSAVDYIPFRKDLYVEVPALAKMTPEEVNIYRESLENITVKGKNCPKPIKNWAQAGVSRKVLDLLRKFKYESPTPIQAQALPAVMSGRDVMGIAKTGSGKTLAFLLPLFRHIADQPPLEEGDGAIGIIMAPTRELCMQIGKECKKFTKALNLRAVCVYGGTGISEQIAELKRGAEIIVCTPGRMIDMLAANNGRVTNLRRVTFVVLDEADRMFDMGFEPQVMRIIDNVRPDRQTVLFSATFPRQMEALARRILTKPIEIQVL
jgi:ATP-dependent RNA helicase DDX46/PRP5